MYATWSTWPPTKLHTHDKTRRSARYMHSTRNNRESLRQLKFTSLPKHDRAIQRFPTDRPASCPAADRVRDLIVEDVQIRLSACARHTKKLCGRVQRQVVLINATRRGRHNDGKIAAPHNGQGEGGWRETMQQAESARQIKRCPWRDPLTFRNE